MNDSEIIKALECCTTTKGGCKECPMKGYEKVDCQLITATEAYKLINRQQAGIEFLKTKTVLLESEKALLTDANKNLQELYREEQAKVESAKQKLVNAFKSFKKTKHKNVRIFADRLKGFIVANCCVVDNDVDKIYKEIKRLVEETGYNDG